MAKLIETTVKGIRQKFYCKFVHCKAENKGSAIATYGYFTNAKAAKDRQNAVELRNISFTSVSDVDIFRQAYKAISELAEFEGAEDC